MVKRSDEVQILSPTVKKSIIRNCMTLAREHETSSPCRCPSVKLILDIDVIQQLGTLEGNSQEEAFRRPKVLETVKHRTSAGCNFSMGLLPGTTLVGQLRYFGTVQIRQVGKNP